MAAWPYDPLEGPVDPRTGTGSGLSRDGGQPWTVPPGGCSPRSPLSRAGTPRTPCGRHAGSAPQAAGWEREAALLLERRSSRARSRDVHLPGHISASTLVDLGEDAEAVVQRLRRPVPREPGMSARKGTAFHAWVEEYFGTAGMLDLGEAPGSDNHIDEAYGLDDMVATFKDSRWAHRSPAYVEVPVETRIGDVVVRGRIDAVFRDADGGWDLVDWKTGRRPSAGQLKTKSVQLAVYRLAWARLKGVPVEEVRAAFFYVADNHVVRPHDLASGAELEGIVAAALARGRRSVGARPSTTVRVTTVGRMSAPEGFGAGASSCRPRRGWSVTRWSDATASSAASSSAALCEASWPDGWSVVPPAFSTSAGMGVTSTGMGVTSTGTGVTSTGMGVTWTAGMASETSVAAGASTRPGAAACLAGWRGVGLGRRQGLHADGLAAVLGDVVGQRGKHAFGLGDHVGVGGRDALDEVLGQREFGGERGPAQQVVVRRVAALRGVVA